MLSLPLSIGDTTTHQTLQWLFTVCLATVNCWISHREKNARMQPRGSSSSDLASSRMNCMTIVWWATWFIRSCFYTTHTPLAYFHEKTSLWAEKLDHKHQKTNHNFSTYNPLDSLTITLLFINKSKCKQTLLINFILRKKLADTIIQYRTVASTMHCSFPPTDVMCIIAKKSRSNVLLTFCKHWHIKSWNSVTSPLVKSSKETVIV